MSVTRDIKKNITSYHNKDFNTTYDDESSCIVYAEVSRSGISKSPWDISD